MTMRHDNDGGKRMMAEKTVMNMTMRHDNDGEKRMMAKRQ